MSKIFKIYDVICIINDQKSFMSLNLT